MFRPGHVPSVDQVMLTDGGSPPGRPRLLPLVVCAGASQAQLVVLAPTVSTVAAELGVPVGVVGQARSVTALAAILAALLALTRPAVRRVSPARLAAAGGVLSLAG